MKVGGRNGTRVVSIVPLALFRNLGTQSITITTYVSHYDMCKEDKNEYIAL